MPDYFQPWINPHLVLGVYLAAGRCVWDKAKINYSVCDDSVIQTERHVHPRLEELQLSVP